MTQKEILTLLAREDSFIITTHESPDGDALGSQLALFEGLKLLDKKVFMINSDPVERRYGFLIERIEEPLAPDQWLLNNDPSEYHLIIVDTTPDNIGSPMNPFLEKCRDIIPIDHHDTIEPGLQPKGFYNSQASSTCEMIYELLQKLKVDMSLSLGQALFTGMVYDTGSFRYKKTGARTLAIASELVEMGVNPFEIHTRIYQSNTKASLMLLTKVMTSLEFFFGDQVALLSMKKKCLEETGASFEEAQTLINIPLGCQSVEVSVFFKEDERGLIKCSLRSKGRFNCLSIAEAFGGGGHETAAGFKLREPVEIIQTKVLAELENFFT